MKTLWLIDGSSLVYRSFFAFIRNPLRNSKGQNTSAVFGFLNSLLKLLETKKPEYLLISFDPKGPTFRHTQFEEYKATRPKLPKELGPQIPIIKDLVKSLGIQVLEIEGIEADDVIGSIASMANKEGWEVIIFSEDKDFLQLEAKNLKILNPRTFEFTGAQERLGVSSSEVPDFLALTGDAIDNVPGIPGIGAKTASSLISQFGKVEKIIEQVDKIEKKKISEAIKEHKEQLLLAKKLTTLNTNYKINISLEELKIKPIDKHNLLSTLKELEFFSIIKKLDLSEYKEYKISQLDDFSSLIENEISIFFFDSYFSISCKKGITGVFKNEREKLKKFIGTPEIRKIILDSKSLFANFDAKGKIFDISIASYLLKPDLREHSLENLALKWLNKSLPSLEDEKTIINSLGERASTIFDLCKLLEEKLKIEGLEGLFYNIELPLAQVLADMELKGVLIDKNYFYQESKTLGLKLKEIEEEIYQFAGEKFNLRSPKQLSYILFDKLKLPKQKRKKTGFSTDYSVLTELAKTYELPRKILSYRELFKLKSTYIDVIPKLTDNDGRVHTTWQQTTTATGRLSSTNPNLQNIPHRETRKGFIAPPGWHILSADYSQIELRILASLSEDSTLISAFRQGKDIHTNTASLIFNIPESQVTKDERRVAKIVNFGIIYGMGPYGLSQRLELDIEKAASFIASYFLTYPGVKSWINETLNFARKNGYTETLMGRKRWLPYINSNDTRIREAEERICINSPIQGSAADMIKIAMIKIHNRLKNFKANLIMQIHDELVLEIPEEEIEEVKRIVQYEMENALPLKVPVVIDIGIGKNWYEAL
jgi:DNA polymerase-1